MDFAAQLTWTRLAGITGTLSVLSYFGAAFLPVPDVVTRLLAFAFGPLLSVSFVGVYRSMAPRKDGPILQLACIFGIVAGVMVTSMLVVQVGNNMVRADMLASAETEAARDSVLLAWRAVNRVQYLLDVVWDIFICLALILLGTAMVSHPVFGKIWGSIGVLVSFGLLFLNLLTFPFAPGEVGLVDLGPLVAIWMLAVFIRFLLIKEP
jgi:hypothetical protein